MQFDVALPSAIFLITIGVIFLYPKYERRLKSLFEERKMRVRDIFLLVGAMGAMITLIALVPSKAIIILFLWAYSVALFLFTYLILPKWYVSILLPTAFIIFYLSYSLWDMHIFWNIYTFNLFAVIFALFISIYLSSLFTWKTTLAFALFITIIDIIQVSITGFMVGASEKMLGLGLPIMVILPTIPLSEHLIGLGLGDFFLAGLLCIQTTKKYGKKLGVLSALSISLTFFAIQSILLTYAPNAYPATVFIVAGWLISFGIIRYSETKVTKRNIVPT
jgi:hypothetical protein